MRRYLGAGNAYLLISVVLMRQKHLLEFYRAADFHFEAIYIIDNLANTSVDTSRSPFRPLC